MATAIRKETTPVSSLLEADLIRRLAIHFPPERSVRYLVVGIWKR